MVRPDQLNPLRFSPDSIEQVAVTLLVEVPDLNLSTSFETLVVPGPANSLFILSPVFTDELQVTNGDHITLLVGVRDEFGYRTGVSTVKSKGGQVEPKRPFECSSYSINEEDDVFEFSGRIAASMNQLNKNTISTLKINLSGHGNTQPLTHSLPLLVLPGNNPSSVEVITTIYYINNNP